MLTKGKFLVSFNLIEWTRYSLTKRVVIGETQELEIAYRTEELRPYLRYPNLKLESHHTHYKEARKKLLELFKFNDHCDINIIDIIPLA